jgi:hypothetical protein
VASSLRIEGAASVTTVDIGQDVAPYLAKGLGGAVSVTFYLYNGSGAQFVPKVRVDTCDAHGEFSAVTNREEQSATAAPNAAWTLCAAALDLSVADRKSVV